MSKKLAGKRTFEKKMSGAKQNKQPPIGSPEFQALQQKWYAKLAKEGFEDIEWTKNPTQGIVSRPKKYDPDIAAIRQTYHTMAELFLTYDKTLKGPDRFIWRLRVNGKSYKYISKAFTKKYGYYVSDYKIYYWAQRIMDKCKHWNTHNPKGYLYKGQDNE